MEILKKINEYWKQITGIVAILVAIWGVFSFLQGLRDDNKKILSELQTTKQMALKSVIWNDEIPITDQTSACDIYITSGYNSMTKKRCEIIIEEGAKHGIFSSAD